MFGICVQLFYMLRWDKFDDRKLDLIKNDYDEILLHICTGTMDTLHLQKVAIFSGTFSMAFVALVIRLLLFQFKTACALCLITENWAS